MKRSNAIELGLTIPLQRHLHIKALPYSQEPDHRFCWDLHVIPLRGRPSLLAVHCHTRYTFVLYDLSHPEWEHLPDIFLDGLRRSLFAAGFAAEETKELCGSELPLFTRTHGRREVAFLNRAWEDVMATELALDESSQSQPLLDQLINAKPSRCAGMEGLDTAERRLTEMLSQI
ncbi:hypothetical protein D1641_14240 [Colidextribacter sp. OB.20]|uniref:DUF6933 domain-containing protein n=1 Tax=Colidextribacter sp. OB.20 TaxID=2304568 RepID=UPI00136B6E47|nr:hypothetical protein [Colidextribacter sp. OB.20]NBI11161.1 hypothetical protein [Colidextribacter sp. OB.20]